MIEKITYVAFDGEEFETKEACVAHEESLSKMSEHVQLFDCDLTPIRWNPCDYDGMRNNLAYIVIEPHYEEEVEEWWDNTFSETIGVSPFNALDYGWKAWKRTHHDDKPTILIYDFMGSGYWEIFNDIYARVNEIASALF